jgi:cyclopropane-fatty-acyl-phospholipid synthase
MKRVSIRRERGLRQVAAALEEHGANLTVLWPGADPIRIGTRPESACVRFRDDRALDPLHRRDHLGLAEAYLDGAIDIDGEFIEAMRITEVIAPDPRPLERLRSALRLLLRDRRRLHRDSIEFHYDLAPDFYLPWLGSSRSYSHGLYTSPGDSVDDAQERKLAYAVEALGLEPGMSVFDMGGGWGSFLEYAGRRGIHVHAITISEPQYQFVNDLIRTHDLPCQIELVDFLDYEAPVRFDGAVFMGTFEHFSDYRWAARFLRRHLKSNASLYTDFCAHDTAHQVGAFLAKYIWPGAASYVDPRRLRASFEREGFVIRDFADDTASYASTVRDWSDALERSRSGLAAKWGERRVRAFLLYLRASQYYFEQEKIQAYHMVATRCAADPSAHPVATSIATEASS